MSKSLRTTKAGKEKKKDNITISEDILPQEENEELGKKYIKIRINTIVNVQEMNVKFIIQHADNILGESEAIVLQEGIETDVNFEVVLSYISSNMKSLDEIVANPILFIINEYSTNQNTKSLKPTKEMKKLSKEDNIHNTHLVGQCNLDLLPLFLGELHIHENLLIYQVKRLAPQEMLTWPNLPRLSVFVSTEDPLVTSEQFESMNILFITLGSMYNIPSRMVEMMQYSAATVFPLQNKDLKNIFFHNGIFKSKKQMDKSKRWAGLANLPGRSSSSLYNMSDEIIRSKLPVDMNVKLNDDTPRIEWNMLRRCLITAEAGETMYDMLSEYNCWILEILVTDLQGMQPTSSKTKSTDTNSRMHYVAYLDLSTLLYPGVRTVKAAAQVFTYTQDSVASKFCLNEPLFENISPAPINKESSSSTKTKPPTSSGTKTKKSEQKSSSKTTSQPPSMPTEESVPLFNEEGDPTFVIMEVELYKPLMQKRSLEQLESQLSQIIPPRPSLPKRVMATELAEKHYSSCIKTLSDIISREYQKFMQKKKSSDIHLTDLDEFQTSFFYFLNSTGIYDEMKLTLKNKISLLLQEKSDIKLDTGNDLVTQHYISEVYIYLVEEMYAVLNGLIGNETMPVGNLFSVSTDRMLYFAMEAEELDMLDNANHWYLERILLNNKDPEFWLDYGIFYLKQGHKEKATESVREALQFDTRHKIGLLLYATILAQDEEYRVAEIFFDALTSFYPRFAEAWITFNLFYLKTGNFIGAEIALTMSTKCFDSKKDLESVIDTESLLWCTKKYNNDSLFLVTAITLIKLHIYEFAEMALAQELIYNGTSIPYLYYLSVLHYLEARYEDAIGHITSAVKQHGKDYCLWSLMGHCHHQLGNKRKAMDCYQYVVDSFNRPNDIHLVELRLGEYYLEDGNYEMARTVFLDACKYTPTPMSWLSLGIACYKMDNFMEAETALKEGNALDNKKAAIWGYLALVNLQCERRFQFEQCYRQAIRHGLQDQSIIQEIRILQKKLNFPDPVPLIFK